MPTDPPKILPPGQAKNLKDNIKKVAVTKQGEQALFLELDQVDLPYKLETWSLKIPISMHRIHTVKLKSIRPTCNLFSPTHELLLFLSVLKPPSYNNDYTFYMRMFIPLVLKPPTVNWAKWKKLKQGQIKPVLQYSMASFIIIINNNLQHSYDWCHNINMYH